MSRTLRYVLLTLLWVLVGGYLLFAAVSARRARSQRLVERLEIEMADSTSRGSLLTSAQVREWIARSGAATIGTAVDAVDLPALEELIARNGFVSSAVAYVDYSGTLRITIAQRRPLLRLRTDGIDAYVTADGFVFPAPKGSSLYVPVVTGPYVPPFPKGYAGSVRECVDAEIARIGERVAGLEQEKHPLYQREIENDRRIAQLRRRRIKRQWWRFESARDFERRVAELRQEKAILRRSYRYEARIVAQEIEALERRQEEQRRRQKKLEKSYEDFAKLLTFVERVESDAFRRSEVVQIVARTTPGGALEVDLVPRSGRHTIRFGRLEDEDRKFDNLVRFYRSGLSRIGWEEFRTIDLRYNDQVVCRK
ncbi:MAG: hypothetical protein K2L06_02125 [Alistipes sp.]|nr:hypothetical protein [Alistipes sp.]